MTAAAFSSPPPLPQPYRPDIDGLRAIAVMAVVLYHAGVAALPGGFAGVDVFFVISGYLITGLIAPDMAAGRFSFAHFYERRVRRILPAMLAVVAACLAAGFFILTPIEYRDLGRSAIATLLFYANFHFSKRTGYFDGAAEEKPLLHMWSLAVEEQFYLVFPVMLWLVYRFARPKLAQVVVALWGLSLTASIVQTWLDPAHAYFMPQTRMWQLLTGSILALGLAPPWRSAAAAGAAALAGLGCIFAAAIVFSPATPFPGWAALLPCLGAAAVMHAGRTHTTLAARLLSAPPVLLTGLASYSIYLWHWPLLVFARLWIVRDFTGVERLWVVAAAVLAGIASWRLVERPFRKSGGLFPGFGIFAPVAAAGACVAGLAMAVDFGRGIPQRLDPRVAALTAAAFEWHEHEKECPPLTVAAVKHGQYCAAGTAGAPASVMLIGDSHARALLPAFAAALSKAGLSGGGFFSPACLQLSGAVPAQGRDDQLCGEMTETIFQYLSGAATVKTVIITARWAWYANGTRAGFASLGPFLWRDSETATPSAEENGRVFVRSLRRAVDRLKAAGKTVILIGPVPEVATEVPGALAREAMRGVSLGLEPKIAAFEERQKTVLAEFRAYEREGIPVFYPHRILCGGSGGICRLQHDGQSLYADDNHLSRAGAALMGPLFGTLLETASAMKAAP